MLIQAVNFSLFTWMMLTVLVQRPVSYTVHIGVLAVITVVIQKMLE